MKAAMQRRRRCVRDGAEAGWRLGGRRSSKNSGKGKVQEEKARRRGL